MPRQTPQRQAIAEVIAAAPGPVTIAQIRNAACQRIASLGVATVYRTVKMLLEAGTITAVILEDGAVRYESAHLGHHHHFRCRTCEQVFDLDICPVSLPEGTTLPGGYRVDGHDLTLYGLCPACGRDDTQK